MYSASNLWWFVLLGCLLIALAPRPAVAQNDLDVIGEMEEVLTDVSALGNSATTSPRPNLNHHDKHDHDHGEMDNSVKHSGDNKGTAADAKQESEPEKPDDDRTATIVGSLLMVFIVGVGLIIAYVLTIYKKRMDDQQQLGLEV